MSNGHRVLQEFLQERHMAGDLDDVINALADQIQHVSELVDHIEGTTALKVYESGRISIKNREGAKMLMELMVEETL